ncbi:MAG: hypothetical protein JRN21_09320 [Nitrososphaerota archaeon]|nr:hypothetical protein [Nitrososphaerota archaeon]
MPEQVSTATVAKAVTGIIIGVGSALNPAKIPIVSLLGSTTVEIAGIALAAGSATYAIEKTLKHEFANQADSVASQGSLFQTIKDHNETAISKKGAALYTLFKADADKVVTKMVDDFKEITAIRAGEAQDALLSSARHLLADAGMAPPTIIAAQPAQRTEQTSRLVAAPEDDLVAILADAAESKPLGELPASWGRLVETCGLVHNPILNAAAFKHLTVKVAKPVTPSQKVAQTKVAPTSAGSGQVQKLPQPPQAAEAGTPNSSTPQIDMDIPTADLSAATQA